MSKTQQLIQVTVFSPLMGEKIIDTEATTWKGLQGDLDKAKVSYDGMKAVIGESRLEMSADEAIIPNESFTLFLMPIKTKSGKSWVKAGYKEMRSAIQALVKHPKKGAQAQEHFNAGKNYTTKSTEELRRLLVSWDGGKSAPAPAKQTAKAVAKPAKSKVESEPSKATVKAATQSAVTDTGFTKVQISEMGYKQLRSTISGLLAGASDNRVSLHFNGGKNYTTKPTEELRKLLLTYKAPKGGTSSPAATPKASPTKSNPVPQKATAKKRDLRSEYDKIKETYPGVKGSRRNHKD